MKYFLLGLFCTMSLYSADKPTQPIPIPKLPKKCRPPRFIFSSDDTRSYLAAFRKSMDQRQAIDRIAEAEEPKFDEELKKAKDFIAKDTLYSS